MENWRPQHYLAEGRKRGKSPKILAHAAAIGNQIVGTVSSLPPIFTLRHLAYLSDTSYGFLRAVVSRALEDPYRVFRIAKSVSEPKARSFRMICVPDPELMKVQRWIAEHILACGQPHPASYAYVKRISSTKKAAELHCDHRWLIKLDVKRFFESISEIAAYHVFRSLGYQPLVSFELARLCTRLGSWTPTRSRPQWLVRPGHYGKIESYSKHRIGHLPQGAPTSPMLSNLAMVEFDKKISRVVDDHGLAYTRYADDLCLSTDDLAFSRAKAATVIGKVYGAMAEFGLSPNFTKTRVSPPGNRKVVLGLLVDGKTPRLTREFRACLRQHIYYLTHPEIGPAKHAAARGFVSIIGLRNHMQGLIAYARHIDSAFASSCTSKLSSVNWPL